MSVARADLAASGAAIVVGASGASSQTSATTKARFIERYNERAR